METKHIVKRLLATTFVLCTGFALFSQSLANFFTNAEERRVIEKSYKVSDLEIFEISNHYGKVSVTSWDQPVARLTITVISRSTEPERARQRLEEVEIRERKYGQIVQLETRILNNSIRLIPNQGLEVNYDLKLPPETDIEITNKFGDIYLDDRIGNVEVDLRNGNLIAKTLKGKDNRIEVQFGQGDIANINGGLIDFSYGQLLISEADNIILQSNGAIVQITEIDELELAANLGELRVAEVAHVKGNYSATKFTIERLTNSIDLEVKAALSCTIEEIASGFEYVNLTGNYTAFNLGFEDDAIFDVEADVQFGKLTSHNLGVELKSTPQPEKITHYTSPTKVGTTARVSQAQKVGNVIINSHYGNVRLWK